MKDLILLKLTQKGDDIEYGIFDFEGLLEKKPKSIILRPEHIKDNFDMIIINKDDIEW